ncbi:MAG: peptidoglycan DD-metalloendopeptidase family protein, partial [Campylobacter sp.]|nr:peptidoglycan DD-metalloendopeptidase family protein [Campylobacter sp.]
MNKFILIFFLFFNFAFAINSGVEKFKWPEGVSLLQFMEKYEIPLSVYYDLDKEAQELTSEIISGSICYVLRDDLGKISQLLIPISEELQIQIYKDKFNKFKLDFTPIVYTKQSNSLGISIETSPYNDIVKATGNTALANEFMSVFRGEVDFKRLQKGDRLVLLYEQKTRLGQPFGSIKILAGMIEENKKGNSLYLFEDKYFDENGKKMESFLLITPINGARIASRFTPKRFHPILKRYRAHLGVDYAAPKGTKIYAAGNGKVTFVGRKSGYGNTVEISHGGGYSTLYAHLNGFAKGIKVGTSVKQKELIAYVGNTGLSTGPHLHFGLYKNKQAIDPLKVVKIEKTNIVSKEELKFKALVKDMNAKMDLAKDGNLNPQRFENF